MKLTERMKQGWNAFLGREPTTEVINNYIYGASSRPDRVHLSRGNTRSLITSIYNKIAVDVAAINFRHVRLDTDDRYLESIDSDLNNIFKVSANTDQTGRQLIQDLVISMLDEGCVALVPIETSANPFKTDSYKIYSVRVGKIIEWFPETVKIEVYNEKTGKKESIILPKSVVPIIENPFYSTMNEYNSTLQRLIRILNQIDRLNEENAAGKMDIIIQLPYSLKSNGRKAMAEERRMELEAQLTGSQYGIGYIDGTEKVIQLNRPVENNLWQQATDLKAELFSQLRMAPSIFDGTADEKAQLNYYNGTVEPICTAIQEAIICKWLTKTAISQRQSIKFFRDPFKLVPVNSLAEISDKFTRNEIMTSNEFRSIIGYKPSDDPKADKLLNSNLNHPELEGMDPTLQQPMDQPMEQPMEQPMFEDPMLKEPM